MFSIGRCNLSRVDGGATIVLRELFCSQHIWCQVLNDGLAGQRDTAIKVVASVSGPLEVKPMASNHLMPTFLPG